MGDKQSALLRQHRLAINLLKKFGLDYVRLEPERAGHYRYHAWTVPRIESNGSPPISKRGRVQKEKERARKLRDDLDGAKNAKARQR
jgi:hypothetical protein